MSISLSLSSGSISTELPAFVMGILNATSDSFWKDSRVFIGRNWKKKAIDKALEMIEMGVDIIDIGGESTRPGSEYIEGKTELERVLPVVEGIRKYSSIPISIDTRKKMVFQPCYDAGCSMLNDISALEDDEELATFVGDKNIPVILMHKRGIPVIMQKDVVYTNPVQEVAQYLTSRVEFALSKGISPEHIILDSGIGFGKNLEANLALAKSSDQILRYVCEHTGKDIFHMVMALSRKTCIGEITGKPVEKRMAGTLAANLLSVEKGATILRVHDVEETVDMLRIMRSFK
jgi:dihydropteroate synthase